MSVCTLSPRAAAVADLQLLTVVDVADILQLSERRVKNLIRSGSLQPTKTFGRDDFRFSRIDLKGWIQTASDEVLSNG